MKQIIFALMLWLSLAWTAGASAKDFPLKVGQAIKTQGSFIGLETNEYINRQRFWF